MSKKTDQSQSLEIVSEETGQIDRRNLPRLCLTAEQFRLDETGKIFPLIDLSHSGMAIRLLDREDRIHFSVGREIRGMINLRRTKHPVLGKVRRIAGETIGVEFLELEKESKAAIEEFLDPTFLGSELRLIPNHAENDVLWYHGPSGADLLVWRKPDGEWSRFSLFVHGVYVQWSRSGEGETGRVQSSGIRVGAQGGLVWLDALNLKKDSKLDLTKMTVAKKIIQSSSLPEDIKTWCSNHLTSS